MSDILAPTELDRIAGVMQRCPYEGYPALKDRLYMGAVTLHASNGLLIIPEGPWHVSNYPNRRGVSPDRIDPEVPSPEGLEVAEDLSAGGGQTTIRNFS